MAEGLCSPSAQRTASVMLDLPEPFGPTITLTPGENVSRVRSGNDLNPFRLIAFRYIEVAKGGESEASRVARTASALQRLERVLRGRLLGLLLAPAGSDADLIAAHRRPDLEAAVVRRPGLARDL